MAGSSSETEQSAAEEVKLAKAVNWKMKMVHDTESEPETSEVIPEYMSSDEESDFFCYTSFPQSPAERKLVKAEKRKRKRIVHDTESESEVIPEYMSSDEESGFFSLLPPSPPPSEEDTEAYEDWLLDTNDGTVPLGASVEHRKDFDILFSIYNRQLTESEGFDIDDFPGPEVGATVPQWGSSLKKLDEPMTKLAKWAIDEYNKKKCSEFKYEVFKIEKVNGKLGGNFSYYMTVKVLNTTLVTALETFQIGVSTDLCSFDDGRMIFLCRPKEEEPQVSINGETRKHDADVEKEESHE